MIPSGPMFLLKILKEKKGFCFRRGGKFWGLFSCPRGVPQGHFVGEIWGKHSGKPLKVNDLTILNMRLTELTAYRDKSETIPHVPTYQGQQVIQSTAFTSLSHKRIKVSLTHKLATSSVFPQKHTCTTKQSCPQTYPHESASHPRIRLANPGRFAA